MAYAPIAFIAPNYRDYGNHWLKAYEPGTTTPKAMALDPLAAVTVAKLQLNIDGFLESAGGAIVMPYILDAYDLWLFPTEVEADANDTVNAKRLADDITPAAGGSIVSGVLYYDTVDDMVTSDEIVDGDRASTGYTEWKIAATAPDGALSLTGSGLFAIPQTALYTEDFGSDYFAVQQAINIATFPLMNSNVIMPAGVIDCSASGIQLPSNRGINLTGAGYDTILDSSAAITAFNTVKAPITVSEKMILKDFRIKASPVAGSYGLDWSRCRNGSYYEGITVDTGANGIFQTESWYNSGNDSFVRNCTGIGWHFFSDSFENTINAAVLKGVWANGNGTNYKLESTGGTSTPLTILGGTSEKSVGTSFTSVGFSSVTLVGFYFENNFDGALANDIVDLEMQSGTCNMLSGSFQTKLGTGIDSGAFLVGGAGVTHIGDSVFIRTSNVSNPFDPASKIHVGRLIGADYTDVQTKRNNPALNNEISVCGNLTAADDYLKNTTQPVAKVQTISSITNLFVIDLTTVQSNDTWAFELTVNTASTTAVRWGTMKCSVSVRKVGATWNVHDEEIYNMLGAASFHGSVTVSNVDGVITISFNPTTETYIVRSILHPIIGSRVLSIT